MKNYLTNAKSSDEANPLYWAGLVMYGNDKTFDISKPFNYWLVGIVGGLIALVLIGFLIYRKKSV